MDLNGDGNLDLLSGSYSRQDKDMAGLFQVLWGNHDGTFEKAAELKGSDGEPLLLPRGKEEDDIIDRICTRPFAVDLNGDDKLDIVAGNFRGTFAFFAGEGKGKFAPVATMLKSGGKPMAVQSHGDPFLIDWDKDGDFDLLSGSAQGGVFLFENIGNKGALKFAAMQTLLKAAGHANQEEVVFGDAHCKAPASDTRVWADDVNGDGKLDLLVGDTVTLMHAAKGVEESAARTKFVAWQKKQQAFFQAPQAQDEAGQKKWQEQYAALEKERETFASEQRTGHVWLFLQK